MLDTRVQTSTPYGELGTLSFNQQFVYVCFHAYEDYLLRLRYLIDVCTAMQQSSFDRENMKTLANRYGAEKQVSEVIELAEYFFGEPNNQSLSNYAIKVIDHFISSDSFPKRSHPNLNHWARRDKN